jgi:diacylglycerol kinase family enzyme
LPVRRLLLVANPSASGFTGAAFRGVVDTLGGGFEVTPVWPDTPVEATAAAAAAAAEGVDVVVAMGGDGVVHRVANGLVGTATSLGILPAGTTNVLARIHRMPDNPVKAAGALLTAIETPVPAAHIATEGDHLASDHALFALGVGFDAEVVAAADQTPHSKLWFGSVHYARTALSRAAGPIRRRQPNLRVECDGRRVDAVSVFVQVHDLYTYFGRVPIRMAPATNGGLTALAVEHLDPRTSAAIVARLVTRRSLESIKGVHLWEDVSKLVIEAEPPSPLQADGEVLGSPSSVEVNPVPFALTVLVPR